MSGAVGGPDGPARPAPRSLATFGAVLFALAFLLRAGAAAAWAREPVWDGHYYDFGARRIAAGFGYSDDLTVDGHSVWHPWCHYPVGYSAFLALFYRLLGPSLGVANLADALTGAALALVTWLLARSALSERRAAAAGLAVALYPGLVLYGALEMSEPLAALLAMTAFWLAARDARPARGVALGALVLGLGALVRPQSLLCAPFLAFALPRRPDQRWASRAGELCAWGLVASALSLVVVLPWTARNCKRMDGCALVSTNAGWNLAIGAFPRATGRFETLRASDGCRVVTGQVQQDRCWLAYGIEQIEEAPGRWLGLVPKKLAYTFNHESFEVEYLHESSPEAWPEPRRALARDVTTLAARLLVCAAGLGVIAFRLRGRGAKVQGALLVAWALLVYLACATDVGFWPLAVFVSVIPWLRLPGSAPAPLALLGPVALVATTVVTHAVFFGEDRYHVVLVPALCILGAAALRGEIPPPAAAGA